MKPGLCQREFKVRFYFGADPKPQAGVKGRHLPSLTEMIH